MSTGGEIARKLDAWRREPVGEETPDANGSTCNLCDKRGCAGSVSITVRRGTTGKRFNACPRRGARAARGSRRAACGYRSDRLARGVRAFVMRMRRRARRDLLGQGSEVPAIAGRDQRRVPPRDAMRPVCRAGEARRRDSRCTANWLGIRSIEIFVDGRAWRACLGGGEHAAGPARGPERVRDASGGGRGHRMT